MGLPHFQAAPFFNLTITKMKNIVLLILWTGLGVGAIAQPTTTYYSNDFIKQISNSRKGCDLLYTQDDDISDFLIFSNHILLHSAEKATFYLLNKNDRTGVSEFNYNKKLNIRKKSKYYLSGLSIKKEKSYFLSYNHNLIKCGNNQVFVGTIYTKGEPQFLLLRNLDSTIDYELKPIDLSKLPLTDEMQSFMQKNKVNLKDLERALQLSINYYYSDSKAIGLLGFNERYDSYLDFDDEWKYPVLAPALYLHKNDTLFEINSSIQNRFLKKPELHRLSKEEVAKMKTKQERYKQNPPILGSIIKRDSISRKVRVSSLDLPVYSFEKQGSFYIQYLFRNIDSIIVFNSDFQPVFSKNISEDFPLNSFIFPNFPAERNLYEQMQLLKDNTTQELYFLTASKRKQQSIYKLQIDTINQQIQVIPYKFICFDFPVFFRQVDDGNFYFTEYIELLGKNGIFSFDTKKHKEDTVLLVAINTPDPYIVPTNTFQKKQTQKAIQGRYVLLSDTVKQQIFNANPPRIASTKLKIEQRSIESVLQSIIKGFDAHTRASVFTNCVAYTQEDIDNLEDHDYNLEDYIKSFGLDFKMIKTVLDLYLIEVQKGRINYPTEDTAYVVAKGDLVAKFIRYKKKWYLCLTHTM